MTSALRWGWVVSTSQGVTHRYDFEHVFGDFGERFEIDGIYFKKYSCMRGTHGGIDAALGIRDEHGLKPEDIKHIAIHTSTYVKQYDKPFPSSLVGAQSNLPYAISVGLYNDMIGMDEMEAGLSDPRVRDMMSRISVTVVPELEEHMKKHFSELTTARAEIETTGGKRLAKTVYLAFGEPENPISYDDFSFKFHTLAAKSLTGATVERLFHLLCAMDTQDDMREIFDILTQNRVEG